MSCQLEIQLKKKEIKLEINYTVLCITGAISSNSSEEISGFSSDRKNNVAKLILGSCTEGSRLMLLLGPGKNSH